MALQFRACRPMQVLRQDRCLRLWLLLVLWLGFAVPASGQFAVGAKAGTAGVGVDLGLGISGPLSLRIGLGVTDVVPFENQFEVDDLTYTLSLPRRFLMVGADLHLLGPLNISGGMIWREGDFALTSDVTGSTRIGGVTYTETGTLTGVLQMDAMSPYVGLSFGRLARRGIGAFLMVGAAVSGEPTVLLSATGAVTTVPGFEQSLEIAREEAQALIPEWLTVWPLIQIGVRIGL